MFVFTFSPPGPIRSLKALIGTLC